jgi:hypothetical protein
MGAPSSGGIAMKPRITMRKALEDPNLLGHALPGDTWRPWRILLIALMGEALTDDERIVFKELTGRDHEAGFRCEEFVAVIGRRGGKSRAMAALVAYVCGLCDHPELVLGERGLCLIIASDQEQALTCLSYVEAAFMGSPLLRQLIESKTQKQIRLTNKLLIMVRASDYRRVRGVTLLLAIADEAAFWTTADSANPDSEIIGALRPALGDMRRLAVLDQLAACETRRTVEFVQEILRAKRRSCGVGREGSKPDHEPVTARERRAPCHRARRCRGSKRVRCRI